MEVRVVPTRVAVGSLVYPWWSLGVPRVPLGVPWGFPGVPWWFLGVPVGPWESLVVLYRALQGSSRVLGVSLVVLRPP